MYKKVVKFSFTQQKIFWVLVFSIRIWYLAYPMDRSYFCKKRKRRAILDKFLFYSERAGSNVDLRVANKCFTDLGFEVHIHRNLRYIDVTNLLEQLATEIDHRQGFPTF